MTLSTLRLRTLLPVLLGLCLAAPSLGAEKRSITEFDLLRFVWIADPQISPDGAHVAYVRVEVNAKKDGYDTSIWIVPTTGGGVAGGAGESRRLTAGPRDATPRWSPDGRQLAFVRSVEENGRPQPPQIYLLPMTGGDARALTKMPRAAGNPQWSPDGAQIAFTSNAMPKDFDKPAAADSPDPAAEQARRTSDVRVITRAVYRANGGGYLDPSRRTAIWVVPTTAAGSAEAAKPVRLTNQTYDVDLAAWSSDGKSLYLTSTRVAEPYYERPDSDLYRVDVTARDAEPTRVVSIDGAVRSVALSPDGRTVAFEGAPKAATIRSYDQPDLLVAPLDTGTARNLTDKYDFDIGSGLAGDQHAPRGGNPNDPIWLDARRLLVVAAEKGRANLQVVDVESAAVTPLTKGDQEVIAFTASSDASRIVALISNGVAIGDLYLVDPTSGAQTQITDVNKTLMSELNLTPPQDLWYPSFDGKQIHTMIQLPPNFDPAKKYPLILNIHGGPHSAYGFTFVHEMQWMAAKGYVVLYPNPRGSTSYGQDFGNIIQHRYPGDDYKDLMAGVDLLIKKGYVDPERLGVTGGSGGGLLTNWTVTQTNRFKAAVSQRSIADWAGFWYTADFTLFTPSWFRAAPFEDPKDFAARSPLTFVTKITTPLMFIEGEQDLRTPPSDGGEQLFRALKYLKRPTVMVQFPGESHELSRSGLPWHRVERLQHIVGWFDKYLQGRDVGTYATR